MNMYEQSKSHPRRGIGMVSAVLLAICGLVAGYEVYAAREQEERFTRHREESLLWKELSEQEWQRYQEHRAHLGSHLEQLTPYEVLGIYSDDPQERRRYARQNARFMLDMHRRMTEFEDLYRRELEQLAGEEPYTTNRTESG